MTWDQLKLKQSPVRVGCVMATIVQQAVRFQEFIFGAENSKLYTLSSNNSLLCSVAIFKGKINYK
jgi:hypothetical protein